MYTLQERTTSEAFLHGTSWLGSEVLHSAYDSLKLR